MEVGSRGGGSPATREVGAESAERGVLGAKRQLAFTGEAGLCQMLPRVRKDEDWIWPLGPAKWRS